MILYFVVDDDDDDDDNDNGIINKTDKSALHEIYKAKCYVSIWYEFCDDDQFACRKKFACIKRVFQVTVCWFNSTEGKYISSIDI